MRNLLVNDTQEAVYATLGNLEVWIWYYTKANQFVVTRRNISTGKIAADWLGALININSTTERTKDGAEANLRYEREIRNGIPLHGVAKLDPVDNILLAVIWDTQEYPSYSSSDKENLFSCHINVFNSEIWMDSQLTEVLVSEVKSREGKFKLEAP